MTGSELVMASTLKMVVAEGDWKMRTIHSRNVLFLIVLAMTDFTMPQHRNFMAQGIFNREFEQISQLCPSSMVHVPPNMKGHKQVEIVCH